MNKRRYAIASTVAATAITALVQGRGHRVTKVAELPLVVDVDVSIEKTKKAMELLTKLGIKDDIDASKASKNIRAGVGKYRNRRFKQKRGPLIIHNSEEEKDGRSGLLQRQLTLNPKTCSWRASRSFLHLD